MSNHTNNGANLGFEDKLWAAAGKLRGNMDAGEPFEEKMPRLMTALREQTEQSEKLDKLS